MSEPLFEEVSDERLDAVARLEVAAARLFVEQGRALLELWDTAPTHTRVGGHPQVLAEAAMLLHLSPLTIDARLAVATALRDHPLLPALMCQGRLGVPHALVAVEETAALEDPTLTDPTLADRVLQAVLADGGRLGWDSTPADLRRALRRAAVRLDPAAAARRRQQQTAQRTGVRLRPLPDGLAALIATGQAGQLTAADRLLDVLSAPAGPDDQRPAGQRQIDALLAALVARAGTTCALELHLDIPVQVTSTATLSPTCAPEPVTIATDLTPDLLALLTEQPDTAAQAPHPAPAPVGPPRQPAAASEPQAAVQPQPEPPVQPAPQAQPRPVDPGGRPVRRQRHDGVPELLGHGPVDPALLGELLTNPDGLPIGFTGITVRRICTDPTGQAVALDDQAVPLRHLLAPDQPRRRQPAPAAAPAPPLTAAGLLTRLLDTLPTPPPATDAYQPTAAQHRLVRARDTTCTFPGCARRSRRTELDHRTPTPHGPTSVTNLHPLCKHHHRLKHDGWTCTRHTDGTTTWTSPRHQELTVPHR